MVLGSLNFFILAVTGENYCFLKGHCSRHTHTRADKKTKHVSLKKLGSLAPYTLWQPGTPSAHSSPVWSPPAGVMDPGFGVHDGVNFTNRSSSPERGCEELATTDEKELAQPPVSVECPHPPAGDPGSSNDSPHPPATATANSSSSGSLPMVPADQTDGVFSHFLLDAVKSLLTRIL